MTLISQTHSLLVQGSTLGRKNSPRHTIWRREENASGSTRACSQEREGGL